MPQLPAGEGQAPMESEPPEEVMERLAHLEKLVVQLKELIRDKDTQLVLKDTELAQKDAQFKVNQDFTSAYYILFNVFYEQAPILFLLLIHRMRKKNLRLASLNSSCRPKPRWLLSTNR